MYRRLKFIWWMSGLGLLCSQLYMSWRALVRRWWRNILLLTKGVVGVFAIFTSSENLRSFSVFHVFFYFSITLIFSKPVWLHDWSIETRWQRKRWWGGISKSLVGQECAHAWTWSGSAWSQLGVLWDGNLLPTWNTDLHHEVHEMFE